MKKVKLERCENCYNVVKSSLMSWIEIHKVVWSHRGEEECIEKFRWCNKCKKEVEEEK